MQYDDYSDLLEELGVPNMAFNDVNGFSDADADEAKVDIQMLPSSKAEVVREWLLKFSELTFVEADASISMSIAKMKDDEAVLHYFSLLFTNFWC